MDVKLSGGSMSGNIKINSITSGTNRVVAIDDIQDATQVQASALQ